MVWHGKKHVVACILYLFALVFAPVTGQAQETVSGVRIVAAESGSYDWENQIFVARGDVVITSGDLLLQGDLVTMDVATGDVWVQGDVRLIQDEQELRGDALLYNVETGEGTFDLARTEVVLPE